ncbi:hypothetical protein Hanom_Chr06g00509071 [Helianthus anomalus]
MSYYRNSPPHKDRENPHLGPMPVNTRPKARQCGEVKHAQFKDRTTDLHLFAQSLNHKK